MHDRTEIRKVEVSVKGRPKRVPAIDVDGNTLLVTGSLLKVARIRDEEWLPGPGVDDPQRYIRALADARLSADIFTFAQKPPHTTAAFDFPMEADNLAAIAATPFKGWWESLPQEARKNVRRAERMGVRVREIEFNDATLEGIVAINNEAPMRQGRPFWHYGKSLEVVKHDYATFLDRSTFIGAFHEDKLVGFIKMVHRGSIASILQILCMNAHQDKRPANALIAEAVKICAERDITHLIYGKYIYGNNTKSPLTEFKRRNGFQPMLVPRYYVPLTLRGRLVMRAGLHHGVKALLPEGVLDIARSMRAKWAARKSTELASMQQGMRPE